MQACRKLTISYEGSVRRIRAGRDVILSLGAIHTPKVLMQSGIGDEAELNHLVFQLSSTYRESDSGFKTILAFVVSGSVRPRYRPAPRRKRSYSGRVRLV